MERLRILLVGGMLGLAFAGWAKEKDDVAKLPAGTMWTSRVSRTVYIADTNEKAPFAATDTTLAEILYTKVVNKELVGYEYTPYQMQKFLWPLSVSSIKNKIYSRPYYEDTVSNRDTAFLRGVRNFKERVFDFGRVKAYRILEEWQYNSVTATTTIQIKAVAPVWDIYDYTGKERGHSIVFWLKYEDVKDLIAAYAVCHTAHSLQQAIWHSYNNNAGVQAMPPSGVATGQKVRTVEISCTDSIYQGKLRYESYEFSSVTQLILEPIKFGKIRAYDTTDSSFSTRMTKYEVLDRVSLTADSTKFYDSVTGATYTTVVIREPPYESIVHYKLLEEWLYNANEGKATVQVLGLAPIKNYDGHRKHINDFTLFWVKYEDIKELLNDYATEHPGSNLGTALWMSYMTEK